MEGGNFLVQDLGLADCKGLLGSGRVVGGYQFMSSWNVYQARKEEENEKVHGD